MTDDFEINDVKLENSIFSIFYNYSFYKKSKLFGFKIKILNIYYIKYTYLLKIINI